MLSECVLSQQQRAGTERAPHQGWASLPQGAVAILDTGSRGRCCCIPEGRVTAGEIGDRILWCSFLKGPLTSDLLSNVGWFLFFVTVPCFPGL